MIVGITKIIVLLRLDIDFDIFFTTFKPIKNATNETVVVSL